MSNIDELTERAEKARGKKAAFGPDIPLESYTSNAPAHKKILTLKTLPSNYQSQSLGVGIDAKEDERSGSYFQLDTSVVYSKTSAQDVEVLSAVSYTHLRAHETDSYLVCRLLLEKKKKKKNT